MCRARAARARDSRAVVEHLRLCWLLCFLCVPLQVDINCSKSGSCAPLDQAALLRLARDGISIKALPLPGGAMSASLLSGAAAGCRCARDPAVGSGMPCLAVAHGLFLHLDQRLHWVLVCRLGPGRLVRRERCRAHMVCAGAWLLADDALRLVPRRLGCRQLQRAGQLCGVPRPQLSSALAPLAAPALGASQVVRGGVPARTASLAARANARRAGCLAARVAAAGLRSGRGRSMPRPDGAGARAVVGGRVLLLWAGPAVLHVRLHLERARLGQGAAAVELCADRRAGAPDRAARPPRAARSTHPTAPRAEPPDVPGARRACRSWSSRSAWGACWQVRRP